MPILPMSCSWAWRSSRACALVPAQRLGASRPLSARDALEDAQVGALALAGQLGQPRQHLALALLDLVHARQQLVFQHLRARLQRLLALAQLEQVLAARAQLARPHGLDQEIDDAGVERGLAHRLVADHGDQHDRHVAVRQRPAEAAGELQPVHLRHAVVEQQQVRRFLLRPQQRLHRIAEVRDPDVRADVLDEVAQHGPLRSLVVDDQTTFTPDIR